MLKNKKQFHFFHLVDPSPWPFFASFSALFLVVGAVLYMHFYQNGGFLMSLGLFLLLNIMFLWWRDVVRESTFQGHHTSVVQTGLKYGMLLFIASEVMFFFAFFWAFFHSSLAPTMEIGSMWPPKGMMVFNPFSIPLVNTVILLLSGASVTWAHHGLLAGQWVESFKALVLTIILAFIFTLFQLYEYIEAPFSISDGIYGSTFFMLTGFHGFHVFIGTCFLTVCLVRLSLGHFSVSHHLGFEAAAWYWHFVDVVWLFLYLFVYLWAAW